MSQLQISTKRERSLAELVVVVLLVLSLMAIFVFYYFKHAQQIEQAGFKQLMNNFSARIVLIKSQWFMQQQPEKMWITEQMLNEDSTTKKGERLVNLTKHGWVTIPQQALACQQVWHTVMATPLSFFKQPISAVLIHQQDDVNSLNQHYCRFSTASGLFFDYNSASGMVKSAVN